MTRSVGRVLVVGNGMFGAAATRHLAERGNDVTSVGAPSTRPDIRSSVDRRVASHTTYSSHNDAARLTRRQDRNAVWAEVTEQAIGAYRAIEAASGIPFFHDVGCLIVSRPGGDGINGDPRQTMDETDVSYLAFEPGDPAWQTRWPRVSFPDTHYVAFEPAPAGFIRPKRLIAAQNVLAERAGAELLTDTVTKVERVGSVFQVETADGRSLKADRVLVAAGGFANFNDLLPAPVAITLKSEVIVLGEVSETMAMELANFPTLKYLIDPGDIEGIYAVPPVQYENGRYYLKLGANTRLDHHMTELSAIQKWFNTETDSEYLPLYEPVLRELWPSIEFLSVQTRPCLITYTADHMPMIEHLGDGLFIATAGNGGGAKGSDAWGQRAADLL